MKIEIKLTEEEKIKIIEKYLRLKYLLKNDFVLTEVYASLGEFTFSNEEDAEDAKWIKK